MTDRTQAQRDIAITTPLGEDVVLLRGLSGREELGELFEYELDLVSDRADVDPNQIIGENVTIRVALTSDASRYFNGYVSRFSQVDFAGELAQYQATVVPWLWFLTRTADCRIFQEKTVPDIIKEIFHDHGFTDFEEALNASYRTWEYCVQYRETDFNFVSRLMEQEGIYYYFKHEDGKHTLVLSDAYSSHQTTAGYEQVPFYPPDQTRERDHIFDWSFSRQLQPGAYVLNDYDFKAPKKALEATSMVTREHAQAELEVFDYPGEYFEFNDGENYARIRIEELQSEHQTFEGEGNARGLMVGGLFSLTGHPRSDQNREYLIESSTYQIESGDFESAGGGGGTTFLCSFVAIDAQEPYRPPRTTPKPVVQGPQTAMVVGASGEEIWTDEFGRVKVQFHWDRYGEQNENSSCWIRTSHPWAGKSWGSVAIPRIGQEVIVSFLEGDPDRPIITGRVYNGDSMPPFGLPGQAMVSGVKSNTTPGGGGYNEMVMDDTSGNELIRLHGQFDMDSTIENDLREHVLNDRSRDVANNETVSVGNDQSTTIGNNQTLSVGVDQSYKIGSNQTGKVGADKTINVGANHKETIGANQTISVGSNKTETVKINTAETIGVAKELTIGGAYQVSVGAAMNETVGAVKAEEIVGAKVVKVGASSSEDVGANKSVDAKGNITESAKKDVSISADKKMALSCKDDFSIKGDKKGTITLKDELTIKVGKATINMKKNGDITINGKKITIKGTDDIIIKGKKVLQN